MKDILYYSTNTYLANYLTKRFYKGKHYVWCSPVFDPQFLSPSDPRYKIPPSSSPKSIYFKFQEDVDRQDLHSNIIKDNKKGLRKGALAHEISGNITHKELLMIRKMINKAGFRDFEPYVYLINKSSVSSRVHTVPVSKMANPLSEEYLILDLDEIEFDEMILKK